MTGERCQTIGMEVSSLSGNIPLRESLWTTPALKDQGRSISTTSRRNIPTTSTCETRGIHLNDINDKVMLDVFEQQQVSQPAVIADNGNENNLECTKCNIKFNIRIIWERHMRQHKKHEGPHICRVCGKQLSNRKTLWKHLTIVHQFKLYLKCEVCGVGVSPRFLRTHMLEHTSCEPYMCDVGGCGFVKPGILDKHMATHTGVKPYSCTGPNQNTWKCQMCKLQFTDKSNRNRHLMNRHFNLHSTATVVHEDTTSDLVTHSTAKVVHSEDTTGIAWQELTEYRNQQVVRSVVSVNKDDYDLEKHLKTHLPKTLVHAKDTNGKLKQDVSEHKNKNFVTAFTSRCDLCDIVLDDENSFLEHQEQHRGLGTVKCEICGERCIPGRHLQHHTRLHTSDTPYKCEVCSQRFPLPSELDRHLKIHSTAKVVHSEDTIDKALQELTEYRNQQVVRSAVPTNEDDDDLEKHLKTHLPKMLVHAEYTNRKLIQDVSEHQNRNFVTAFTSRCDLCDIVLDDENSFLEHQEQHRGLGTVKCEICGERCIPGRHLQHHTRLHTSDTPYKCEVCSQRFPLPSEFDRHLKIHSTAKVVHSEDTIDTALQELTEYTNQQVVRSAVSVNEEEANELGKHLKTHLTKTLVHAEGTNGKLMQDVSEHQQASQPTVIAKNGEDNVNTNDKVMLDASEQQQVPQSGIITDNFKENDFECTQCDIKFNIKITWERHMRRHKIQDGPHICHVCGEQLSKRKKLWRHLKFIHQLKMSVKCEVCGVRVPQRNLQTHMAMHTGVKSYSCTAANQKELECHLCGLQFAKKSSRRRHLINKVCVRQEQVLQGNLHTLMQEHTSSEPYICEVCGCGFVKPGSLDKHMATHTAPNQNEWKCHLCGLQFASRYGRNRHLSNKVCVKKQKQKTLESGISAASVCQSNVTCKNNKNLVTAFTRCDLCDIVLEDENSFLEHEEQHRESGTVKCEICGERCIPGRHLQHHTMLHTSETPYKCEVCSMQFRLPSELDRHLKTHSTATVLHFKVTTSDLVMPDLSKHQQAFQSAVVAEKSEADNLECTKCDIKFNIRITWERHMRRHKIQDGPHICHVCGKQLSSRQKLVKHVQIIHKMKMAVKCEVCGVKVSQTNLQIHMLKHASSKPYKCEVCGRHFAKASHLDRHMLTHTAVKPHKCKICNRGFKLLSYLNNHTLSVHTQPGQWTHQCPICQKKCPTEGGLKNHMHYHTNKDTYKCKVCGKGFAIRANLDIHSVVHTGVRAYKCDVCGKAFQLKHHLSTHMKSHSTDRPFMCDMCDCSFVLKHHLAAHIHTHEKLLQNC